MIGSSATAADAATVPAAPQAPASTEQQSAQGFIAEHAPRLRRTIARLLGWSDDVDDVLQETLASALEALRAFRGEARPETWLTRIAINEVRNHRRRNMLRIRWLRARPKVAEAKPTDSAAESTEEIRRMREALARLAPRDREVLVLRYLEGLPSARIAELLDIRIGTVDVRISRARNRLQKLVTHG